MSDDALREQCLAFVKLKHEQQQVRLEVTLSGLRGKDLREVVQRELQRVADDTALCFTSKPARPAQRDTQVTAVPPQTKRAQRDLLCRIALDRAQAVHDSQIAPKLLPDVLQELD